ncbi:hypothetical protein LTR37_011815 [Vermiconidia calcicola]|uniref:Uncharacterized protein n=1 Tax=Vermiconidia calcicola TaxID=1690605 RepID=A0ACC3N0V1_9PEZI|nr:hypothetical protein LTR37_011815 [Vermiconidia calcicola]
MLFSFLLFGTQVRAAQPQQKRAEDGKPRHKHDETSSAAGWTDISTSFFTPTTTLTLTTTRSPMSISSTLPPTLNATSAPAYGSEEQTIVTEPTFTLPSTTTLTSTTSIIATNITTAAPDATAATYANKVTVSQTTSVRLPPDTYGTCYTMLGGVPFGVPFSNAEQQLTPGCGSLFAHISSCYQAHQPWEDPYNSVQSEGFRACMCDIDPSAREIFDVENIPLVANFTSCAACLSGGMPASKESVEELQLFDNFCRSQNPLAFDFFRSLSSWLSGLNSHAGATLTSLPLADVTTIVPALQPLYTTEPPLANLAYGSNAPPGGSLAAVTPSMTTFGEVTELVTWLPTDPQETFVAAEASKSEALAVESQLDNGVNWCKGRGPCRLNDAGVLTHGEPGLMVLLLGMGVLVVLDFGGW